MLGELVEWCQVVVEHEGVSESDFAEPGANSISKTRADPLPEMPGGHYGAFYRSALSILLARINTYLVRWTRKKYKRLRAREKARAAWERATKQNPRFFAHWAWVTNPLMIKVAGAE